MQNAVKHLHEQDDDEKKKEKKNQKKKEKKKEKKEMNEEELEEASILSDFSACMFEYEDIAEFEQKFNLCCWKLVRCTHLLYLKPFKVNMKDHWQLALNQWMVIMNI